MKHNIILLLTAALGASAVSCTDLDTPLESQYSEYPINEITVDARLADVYFHMRGIFGRRYMEASSLSADEYTAVSYGSDYYDNGIYARATFHDMLYNDATIDWYGDVVSGITKANKEITLLLGGNDSPGAASARAVRAYFHFILMDCWGDAPILTIYDPDADIDYTRKPRAEVARFIEKELLESLEDLPTKISEENYGKPTRWMAEALLAKLYINWPVYTAASVDQYDAATAKNEKLADCIKVCDDIINSGLFNLGTGTFADYAQKFGPNNNWKCEDFIYVMPYDSYTAAGMQWGRAKTWKNLKGVNPNFYGTSFSQSCGGYTVLSPDFAELFNLDGDVRNDLILNGKVYNRDPETLKPTAVEAMDKDGNPIVLTREITLVNENDETLNIGSKSYNVGNRSIKFFIGSEYNNGRNQNNDVPLLRYADVLLMKAEAIVRGGGSGDAKGLFNQIREYAKAPLLESTPTLDDIYDERGREFLDENWRRNDMIRFGHYEDEYFPHQKSFAAANFDPRHRIWPIPEGIFKTNPNWQQNPGY